VEVPPHYGFASQFDVIVDIGSPPPGNGRSVGKSFAGLPPCLRRLTAPRDSLVQQRNPRSVRPNSKLPWFAPWTKSIGVGWDSLQHPLSITSSMALPLRKAAIGNI
jgi:hypothetical protein